MSSAYSQLMAVLSARGPLKADDLLDELQNVGIAPEQARMAIQLAFEANSIHLDADMRPAIRTLTGGNNGR